MYLSDKEQQKRIEICNKCPERKADFRLFGIRLFKQIPQCNKCKCIISEKVKFDFAECPLGKWEK